MWNQRLVTSLVAAGLLSAIASCKNPRYCPGNPDDDCRQDASPPGSCASDQECKAPAVCDVSGNRTCVECTASEHSACIGTAPVCINTRCQPCTQHAQCVLSNACLSDGSCADAGQVAYVDPTGTDNAICSLTMPCTKIMSALSTTRPYVKLRGTLDETVSISDQDVTLLADPGAKLTRTVNGVILKVDGSSHVQIYDLEVTGASGMSGLGILMPTLNTANLELRRVKVTNNVAGGISVGGGTLMVSQSTISGNLGGGITMDAGMLAISQSIIMNNPGGGIAIAAGQFVVVGNVFFNNGSTTTTAGGISISTAQSQVNRLEFNSFNKNQSQDGLGAAIQCTAGSFMARNNIMSGNTTSTNMEQVGGTCSHVYSIVRPGTLPTGTGNVSVDPLFANTTNGDLHILPMSSAIGAADPSSDLTGIAAHDIDGDARTKPADIGADQHVASGGS